MIEVGLIGAILAFVAAVIVGIVRSREAGKQLQEYKNLHSDATALASEARDKVEVLLEEATDSKVLLEQKVQALELFTARINGQEMILILRDEEISTLNSKLEFQEEQYSNLLSQKKSSEVRTGKITEQIAPFLADYPRNPRTARFIGDPIDFVHFDEDKVTFIEVKSGKSQLSTKQRRIRDLINDGKVEFIIYRVEGS